MEIFAGLRMIISRLLLDFLILSFLTYNVIAPYSTVNFSILILVYAWTFQTVGATKRWTITFPLTPYLILYIARTIFFPRQNFLLSVLSSVIVLLSFFLTVQFPPVQPPQVKGPYKVGVVDLYIPVSSLKQSSDTNGSDAKSNFVSARLLYPTEQETTKTIPYINPTYGKEVCDQFMKIGSPPPLKKFGFILHNWLLIHIPAERNARPLSTLNGKKLPMAVFSHGLVGRAEIYSYQGMSMAANGTVVLMINHSDGTAPYMQLADKSIVYYDSKNENVSVCCIRNNESSFTSLDV